MAPVDRSWKNRTVLGISLASLLSDASYEMAEAVLPLYLQSLGLGASVLGAVEGFADVAKSGTKWLAGVAGQRLERKKGVLAAMYGTTTLCVGAFAFATSALPLVALKTVAWVAKGFRGPLKDSLMAEAVEPSQYGKAYGLERAGDMAGAVVGPLVATLCVWAAVSLDKIFLISVVPGALCVLCVLALVKERPHAEAGKRRLRPPLPPAYWAFLGAVLLFGMGDFSRTFLIFEAGRRMGPGASAALLSVPVAFYVLHNAVSGLVALPAGHLADRWSYGKLLLGGYALGTLCNVGLGVFPGGGLWGLLPLVLVSGVYIAVEETVEKATAARMIPPEARSYALGMLATANAVGDLVSSALTGILLDRLGPAWAYGAAGTFTALGTLALALVVWRAGSLGHTPR